MFTEYFGLSPPTGAPIIPSCSIGSSLPLFLSLSSYALLCYRAFSCFSHIPAPTPTQGKLYLTLFMIARYGHCVFRGLVRPQSISVLALRASVHSARSSQHFFSSHPFATYSYAAQVCVLHDAVSETNSLDVSSGMSLTFLNKFCAVSCQGCALRR